MPYMKHIEMSGFDPVENLIGHPSDKYHSNWGIVGCLSASGLPCDHFKTVFYCSQHVRSTGWVALVDERQNCRQISSRPARQPDFHFAPKRLRNSCISLSVANSPRAASARPCSTEFALVAGHYIDTGALRFNRARIVRQCFLVFLRPGLDPFQYFGKGVFVHDRLYHHFVFRTGNIL